MKRILIIIPSLLGLAALLFFLNFSIPPVDSPAIVLADSPEFVQFLQQFPLKRLPYAITAEELTQRLNDHAAGKQTPTAAQGKHVKYEGDEIFLPNTQDDYFSRSPTYTNPVARMETEQYHAVLYSKSKGFSRGYCSYYLAVFDKSGKRVSNNQVANLGTSNFVTVTLSPALQATTTQYNVNWKKDIEEQGIKGNKVVGITQVEVKNIDLTQPTTDPIRDKRLKLVDPLPIHDETPPAPSKAK